MLMRGPIRGTFGKIRITAKNGRSLNMIRVRECWKNSSFFHKYPLVILNITFEFIFRMYKLALEINFSYYSCLILLRIKMFGFIIIIIIFFTFQ